VTRVPRQNFRNHAVGSFAFCIPHADARHTVPKYPRRHTITTKWCLTICSNPFVKIVATSPSVRFGPLSQSKPPRNVSDRFDEAVCENVEADETRPAFECRIPIGLRTNAIRAVFPRLDVVVVVPLNTWFGPLAWLPLCGRWTWENQRAPSRRGVWRK
jgi:hypothetical protein